MLLKLDMKKMLLALLMSVSLTTMAQYSLSTIGDDVLENKNAPNTKVRTNTETYDVYYNLEDDYVLAKFVYKDAYHFVERVERYGVVYADVLQLLGNNTAPTCRAMSDYKHFYTKPYIFQLGEFDEADKKIYHYTNTKTSGDKNKVNHMFFYFENQKAGNEFLAKLVAKAKEVTGADGYKENRFAFRDFDEEVKKLTLKKESPKEESIESLVGDLDLNLDGPPSATAATTASTQTEQKVKSDYPPVLIKRFGEVVYSIYYDNSTAASLNTKIYKGDKEKLLFTTYDDIYKGQMAKKAIFEVCSWCGIYSIIGEGRRIVFKNKPNSIQSEMIYKNDTWYLVKGSETSKEVDYNTNFDDNNLCYLYPNDTFVKTKEGRLDVESTITLTDKAKLWLMAMLFMAGYEK